ncbi:hypothetical protein TNCV_1133531 [Trichonephila clavipes]|nr:hypothetical protein TNCV_1133531 [Trichonephila clavipes]
MRCCPGNTSAGRIGRQLQGRRLQAGIVGRIDVDRGKSMERREDATVLNDISQSNQESKSPGKFPSSG